MPAAQRSRADDQPMLGPCIAARVLAAIYDKRFALPEWSVTEHQKGTLDPLMKEVTCYRVYGVKEETAKILLGEREPVNIAQHDHGVFYNQEALYSNFGNKTSGYNRLWAKGDKKKLPGAISVYCPTVIDVSGHKFKVHVMNLVALAFDSEKQPDAEFFGPILAGATSPSILHPTTGWKKMEELWNYFITMWDMAYFAAAEKKLKAVCVARIGGNAFGGCLPQIALDNTTVLPHRAIHDYYRTLVDAGEKFANFYEFLYQGTLLVVANAERYKDIRTVHCTNETQPRHAKLLVPDWVKSSNPGWNRVPDCFGIISELEAAGTPLYKKFHLHEILWLNAWDPHSIVGNGNGMDNSLDGFYGRASSLGLMCFPSTNPWIQHKVLPRTKEYMRFDQKISGLKF